MAFITITELFINSYIIRTLLLCNYTIFSVRIGSILNAHYTTSAVDQIYFNITCKQCSCTALNIHAVGWNSFINNYTCQLIRNYSLTDIGFKKMNNTIFYFQNFPFELPSIPLHYPSLLLIKIIIVFKNFYQVLPMG